MTRARDELVLSCTLRTRDGVYTDPSRFLTEAGLMDSCAGNGSGAAVALCTDSEACGYNSKAVKSSNTSVHGAHSGAVVIGSGFVGGGLACSPGDIDGGVEAPKASFAETKAIGAAATVFGANMNLQVDRGDNGDACDGNGQLCCGAAGDRNNGAFQSAAKLFRGGGCSVRSPGGTGGIMFEADVRDPYVQQKSESGRMTDVPVSTHHCCASESAAHSSGSADMWWSRPAVVVGFHGTMGTGGGCDTGLAGGCGGAESCGGCGISGGSCGGGCGGGYGNGDVGGRNFGAGTLPSLGAVTPPPLPPISAGVATFGNLSCRCSDGASSGGGGGFCGSPTGCGDSCRCCKSGCGSGCGGVAGGGASFGHGTPSAGCIAPSIQLPPTKAGIAAFGSPVSSYSNGANSWCGAACCGSAISCRGGLGGSCGGFKGDSGSGCGGVACGRTNFGHGTLAAREIAPTTQWHSAIAGSAAFASPFHDRNVAVGPVVGEGSCGITNCGCAVGGSCGPCKHGSGSVCADIERGEDRLGRGILSVGGIAPLIPWTSTTADTDVVGGGPACVLSANSGTRDKGYGDVQRRGRSGCSGGACGSGRGCGDRSCSGDCEGNGFGNETISRGCFGRGENFGGSAGGGCADERSGDHGFESPVTEPALRFAPTFSSPRINPREGAPPRPPLRATTDHNSTSPFVGTRERGEWGKTPPAAAFSRSSPNEVHEHRMCGGDDAAADADTHTWRVRRHAGSYGSSAWSSAGDGGGQSGAFYEGVGGSGIPGISDSACMLAETSGNVMTAPVQSGVWQQIPVKQAVHWQDVPTSTFRVAQDPVMAIVDPVFGFDRAVSHDRASAEGASASAHLSNGGGHDSIQGSPCWGAVEWDRCSQAPGREFFSPQPLPPVRVGSGRSRSPVGLSSASESCREASLRGAIAAKTTAVAPASTSAAPLAVAVLTDSGVSSCSTCSSATNITAADVGSIDGSELRVVRHNGNYAECGDIVAEADTWRPHSVATSHMSPRPSSESSQTPSELYAAVEDISQQPVIPIEDACSAAIASSAASGIISRTGSTCIDTFGDIKDCEDVICNLGGFDCSREPNDREPSQICRADGCKFADGESGKAFFSASHGKHQGVAIDSDAFVGNDGNSRRDIDRGSGDDPAIGRLGSDVNNRLQCNVRSGPPRNRIMRHVGFARHGPRGTGSKVACPNLSVESAVSLAENVGSQEYCGMTRTIVPICENEAGDGDSHCGRTESLSQDRTPSRSKSSDGLQQQQQQQQEERSRFIDCQTVVKNGSPASVLPPPRAVLSSPAGLRSQLTSSCPQDSQLVTAQSSGLSVAPSSSEPSPVPCLVGTQISPARPQAADMDVKRVDCSRNVSPARRQQSTADMFAKAEICGSTNSPTIDVRGAVLTPWQTPPHPKRRLSPTSHLSERRMVSAEAAVARLIPTPMQISAERRTLVSMRRGEGENEIGGFARVCEATFHSCSPPPAERSSDCGQDFFPGVAANVSGGDGGIASRSTHCITGNAHRVFDAGSSGLIPTGIDHTDVARAKSTTAAVAAQTPSDSSMPNASWAARARSAEAALCLELFGV
eukprot:TRINITY_DN10359_c0_g1_i1.p1 TRINITY_DN10359_c0_g1~~TRINITY_DN10359_c0_g1_i1.p1  ORF type:complete len:1731 (-),score=306.31 TRINITY_DN10359_c0_g1_i1:53-4771(-)